MTELELLEAIHTSLEVLSTQVMVVSIILSIILGFVVARVKNDA